MSPERSLDARHMHPVAWSLATIELCRELARGGIANFCEGSLEIRQRDDRRRPSTLLVRCDVTAPAVQMDPTFHRRLTDVELCRDLGVAPSPRLVGSHHADSKLDGMGVRHVPSRSDPDPGFKSSDQLRRALGLGDGVAIRDHQPACAILPLFA